MWGWDGIIAVLLGFAAWRMAYLGVHVTIHPSGTKKGRTKKSVKIEFYAIALVSTALIIVQAYRTNKAYSELIEAIRRNQSPAVVLGPMGLNQPVQPLVPDQNFLVGMSFVVTDGTAKALHCNIYAFDLPGNESDEQNHDARRELRLRIAKDGEAPGTDMVKGQSCYKGVNLRFSRDQIIELKGTDKMPPRRIIYLAGHAGWKNDAGADFQKDECRWMEPPKTAVVVNPGWHECSP